LAESWVGCAVRRPTKRRHRRPPIRHPTRPLVKLCDRLALLETAAPAALVVRRAVVVRPEREVKRVLVAAKTARRVNLVKLVNRANRVNRGKIATQKVLSHVPRGVRGLRGVSPVTMVNRVPARMLARPENRERPGKSASQSARVAPRRAPWTTV